jgi:GH25 family lysozyme M1 (1,4-beta-N-acetylmuramidase)
MLSEVIKTEQYHFVTVCDEHGHEEKWLLTDGDRERVRTRALNYMLRGGSLVRKVSFFELLLRFVGR